MKQENIHKLIGILDRRKECLQEILQIVQMQKEIMLLEEHELDQLDQCIDKKENLLSRLDELNNEFESFFLEGQEEFPELLVLYRKEAQLVKKYNQEIIFLSQEIQCLELQCKSNIDQYLKLEREKIRKFRINNQMASNYYKNMNGNPKLDSYFMDSRK